MPPLHCAHCGSSLDPDFDPPESAGHVSEGYCGDCVQGALGAGGACLRTFLDALNAPVVVFGPDARVRHANIYAEGLLSRGEAGLSGARFGELFGCAHRAGGRMTEPADSCDACAVRRFLRETAETGRPAVRQPAVQEIETPAGTHAIRFLVSTERVGESVLLRVDEALPHRSPDP